MNDDDNENEEMQEALYAPYSHQEDEDSPTEDPADQHSRIWKRITTSGFKRIDALAEIFDEEMVLETSNRRSKRT